MTLTYQIKSSDKYENILDVIKSVFKISERLLIKLKKGKRIFLNNNLSNVKTKVNINDIVNINIDFNEDNSNIEPYNINLDILYEDDSLLILNKPSNCAIHPSILHYNNSLSNGVKYYFDSIKLRRKIRPVNRLDRDTSGIVIFVKNEYIQESLIKQMKENSFKKEYIAILEGIPKELSGTINAPIARKENSIIERCINDSGDIAITHYKVLNILSNLSIVSFILETGRTHQIRLHSKYIGCPILGDTLYNRSSNLIDRQALHSYKVTFIHPINKQILEIIAPIPEDMLKIMKNR